MADQEARAAALVACEERRHNRLSVGALLSCASLRAGPSVQAVARLPIRSGVFFLGVAESGPQD